MLNNESNDFNNLFLIFKVFILPNFFNFQFFRSPKLSNHKDRFRRDIVTPLSNNMSSIMNVLNRRIDVLQTVANDSSQASCTVTPNGDVKCTNIVYNNPKVWKFSQNHVQKQISNLQAKIEKLKEIQKHLETKRPKFEDEDEEEDNREDDQDEEDSVINLLTDYSQTQWNPKSV